LKQNTTHIIYNAFHPSLVGVVSLHNPTCFRPVRRPRIW